MNLFTRWKDKATEYVDVRLGLFKLSFIERTSTLLGNVMISFLYLFVSLAVLIFLGLGLVETFSALLDSRVGGAFATAGIFVFLLLMLFMLRKTIINAFAGIFIKILTANDDEDDEQTEKTDRKIRSEDES